MKTAYIVFEQDRGYGPYALMVFLSREAAEAYLKEHGDYIEECEMTYE